VNFFGELISASEKKVDAITVGGLLALLVMCGCVVYTAVLDVHTFSPLTFGSGAATILGGYGLGKGGRDRLSQPQPEEDDGHNPG
jgi:hypothetical protein